MKRILSSILFLSLCSAFGFAQNKKTTQSLNIATFNIRMDTPVDKLDSWSHRKEMVKGLIRFHDFDVFGIQEGFYHQINDILELKEYDYVGVGREDGKTAGEHSAIIYKKDKFKVLDKGNFWFSETPNVPSKGWDATCCNRICSWAKFKDMQTGKTFFFFNAHFDHQGKEARRNSSLLLLANIRKIAGKSPVFSTGDFNATPNDEPIRIIRDDKMMKDSYTVTKQPPYGTQGTFNSFDMNSKMVGRIDYIWVNDGVIVNKYGVLNDFQNGHFPSDHFPVMISATLK